MKSAIEDTIQKLGEGKIIKLNSGDTIFKMDSFKDNPIIKPQDMGLTWEKDGKLNIGAVFNGGAEVFQDKIILLPRCHQGYWKSKFLDKKLGFERTCLENYISEVWPLVSDDGIHSVSYTHLTLPTICSV